MAKRRKVAKRLKVLSLKPAVKEIDKVHRQVKSQLQGATAAQRKKLDQLQLSLKWLRAIAIKLPGHRRFFLPVPKATRRAARR